MCAISRSRDLAIPAIPAIPLAASHMPHSMRP